MPMVTNWGGTANQDEPERTTVARQTATARPRDGFVLVHAAFILTGAVTTLLGPMLPVLSAKWALSDSQAGYLFTSQFLSSMTGVVLSGSMIRRCGYRGVMAIGLCLMAMGVIPLAHAGWLGGITAIGVYGLGTGFVSPTANLIVAELRPNRRAAALNILNFSWGVGAVGCPFAVAFLVLAHHTSLFLYSLAASLVLMAAGYFAAQFTTWTVPETQERSVRAGRLWRGPLVIIFGLLFFFYVGAESCISGWIASYTKRMQGPGGAYWALMPSLFWAALLLGRASAPMVLRMLKEKRLASIGLVVASAGVVCLVAANTLVMVSTGAVLTGFGFASVFPIFIAMMSERFGDMANRAAGILFAMAGLGGAVLPNLVGLISTRSSSLRAGLAIPFVCSAAMLILLWLLDGRSDEDQTSHRGMAKPPEIAA
jgi:MFS transporter, FHS family, glucose/mannose:H+ symporter